MWTELIGFIYVSGVVCERERERVGTTEITHHVVAYVFPSSGVSVLLSYQQQQQQQQQQKCFGNN